MLYFYIFNHFATHWAFHMNSKETKSLLLQKLYEPYKKCIACPLGMLGRIFIGEGPGRDEDEQGVPFVGRSGKLLTKVLHLLDIDRKEVFITNVVKCRPPENRKPTPLESTTCKDILLFNQIKIIQPKVICTLGATALESLLGKPFKITAIHGKPIPFNSIIVIPTYHPSYILRAPENLNTFVEDISCAIQLATNK